MNPVGCYQWKGHQFNPKVQVWSLLGRYLCQVPADLAMLMCRAGVCAADLDGNQQRIWKIYSLRLPGKPIDSPTPLHPAMYGFRYVQRVRVASDKETWRGLWIYRFKKLLQAPYL